MNKQQLETQTVKQLMELAKELNITGRHKMKKPELIEAILNNQPTVEEKVEETVELTRNEKLLLNAMRQNEYNDALEGTPTWTFTAIENSGLSEKSAGGVISSLIKKDLVSVDGGYFEEENSTIYFTDKGSKLFENATGKDCLHGGPKLLEVEPEAVEEKDEVEEVPEKQNRSGRTVQILKDGEVIQEFDKTYLASRWLAERFEVKYSSVDRYMVSKLKGREVNVPKNLVGTEFESYEFRR